MNEDYEALEGVALESEEEDDFEAFGIGEEEFGDLGEIDEFEGMYDEELGEVDEFGELEGDEFLGGLWKRVKGVARRLAPILKKVAPIAGRVVGGALGGPAGALIGGKLGALASQLEAEEGFEGEAEDTEDEMEAQVVPGLPSVDDDMAEELAGEAAETESESEAQTLAGGITIHIIGPAPFKVKKIAPVLTRANARLTRLLRKSPQTKPIIKTIPTITKRTVATLIRKAKKGKPVTARTAVRTMAKQTVRTLRSPKKTATAIVKNTVKRRRLKRKAIARAERFAY